MKHYFHGGIHCADGTDKLLSSRSPIRVYVPGTVEISMKQSPGSVCEAVVQKGEHVAKGDIVGKPVRFGSAVIHSGISGTVSDVKTVKDDFNRDVQIVIIDSDGSDAKAAINDKDYEQRFVDLSSYSKDAILSAMKEGGLVGMGGAGFPTHVKYETPKQIETILVNAAECEPYLTCDHRLLLEHAYGIINGVLLLIKAAGAKKAVICLEDNKKDAAENLKKLLSDKGLPVEIRLLATRYPQGGERQLVEAILKKEVPAGSLPAEVGVIINNVATAKALADIVLGNEPLASRVITVTGMVKSPGNFLVPLGTRYCELIGLAGGITAKVSRIIVGGPMTGSCIRIGGDSEKLDGSVSKTSSGLLVLEDTPLIESPCIRCGECERVCPAGLAPFKIDLAAIRDDTDLCERLYATECISCGCCSYVCPAKRELAYRITVAKTEIFRMRRERGGK